MRCSMALSLTRKARAISLTVRPGDDAQGERDLLRRRQIGMAADEQQPQDVVAIVRDRRDARRAPPRHRRDRRCSSSGGSGSCFLRAPRLRRCATLRPTKISQAAGSRGGPFCGQVLSALQARFLKGLLGRVEIAEIAQQRRHRLRPRGGERRVDPGESVTPPALPPAGTTLAAGSRRRRRDWPRRARGRSRAPPRASAVDDVEAEQLLLGLGERPVDHERRLAVLAQRRRGRRRHQPGDGPELAGLGEPVLHDAQAWP